MKEFHELLVQNFPKLSNAGGFELLRCVANTRLLEPISSSVAKSPKLLKGVIGNGRIYIRPIQKDLDLTPVEESTSQELKERCMKCNEEMTLSELRQHVRRCRGDKTAHELSSDEDFELSARSVVTTRHSHVVISSSSDEESALPAVSTIHCIKGEDDAEEMMVQHAMRMSAEEANVLSGSSTNFNPANLGDMVRKLMAKIKEEEVVVTVRRGHVLEDALRGVKRSSFDPLKTLRITFLGEAGEDGGGVRREFWRLFGLELQASVLINSEVDMCTIRHDAVGLKNQKFYHIGRLMAISLVQGGSGFPYFSPSVFKYMSGVNISDIVVTIPEVANFEVRAVLEKIQGAGDEASLREIALEAVDYTIDSGFNKPVCRISLADRPELIQVVALHHTLLICKAEIDQLIEGLGEMGVASMLKTFPEMLEPFFTSKGNAPLTADQMQELFKEIKFSPVGSTEREKEQATYMLFLDFLHDCEEREDMEVELRDVLSFMTGAEQLPPLGLPYTPSLYFSASNVYPTASTCAIHMCLPTKYWNDYSQLKKIFATAFKHHGGFGLR